MQLQSDLIDVGSGGFDMELDDYDRVPGPTFRSLEGMRYDMTRTRPCATLLRPRGSREAARDGR